MSKVVITTAVPLSAAQLSSMKKALEKKIGQDLETVTKVDAEVVGGLRITIGSQEYDGTVATKLSHIQESLLAQL